MVAVAWVITRGDIESSTHRLFPYVLVGITIASHKPSFYDSTQTNLRQYIDNCHHFLTNVLSLRMYLEHRVIR
jgi:hypothetical protein